MSRAEWSQPWWTSQSSGVMGDMSERDIRTGPRTEDFLLHLKATKDQESCLDTILHEPGVGERVKSSLWRADLVPSPPSARRAVGVPTLSPPHSGLVPPGRQPALMSLVVWCSGFRAGFGVRPKFASRFCQYYWLCLLGQVPNLSVPQFPCLWCGGGHLTLRL